MLGYPNQVKLCHQIMVLVYIQPIMSLLDNQWIKMLINKVYEVHSTKIHLRASLLMLFIYYIYKYEFIKYLSINNKGNWEILSNSGAL